jgi:hypothetical protein
LNLPDVPSTAARTDHGVAVAGIWSALSRQKLEPPSRGSPELYVFLVPLQGGGLCIASGGMANLNGCNIYENEAEQQAPVTSSRESHPYVIILGPFHRLLECLPSACLLSQAGGLSIWGVANLTNCNIHENFSEGVQRTTIRSFDRIAGVLTVLPAYAQSAGGLALFGTAHLKDCNVSGNQAYTVCTPSFAGVSPEY